MKFSFGILLVSLAVANAYFPKALQSKWGFLDSKELVERNPRIINGRDVVDGEAPWQISLLISYLGGIITSHTCGGSWISPNFVLTAAHCCDGNSVSNLLIRWGTLKRTASSNADKKVTRVIMHPGWASATIQNDFCILQVDSEMTPGSNAAVISLDDASDPLHDEEVTVTGWGATVGGSSSLPDPMKLADLKILDRDKCNEIWGSVNPVDPSMVCAMSETQSACNGDSGGPLVKKGKLVGVVSWGANSCPTGTGYPNVYACVYKVIEWIKQNAQITN